MISILKTLAFIITFVVLPTMGVDYFFKSGFLDKFMLEQSLSIMGTILAIYIASSASFLAIFLSKEQQKGKKIFNNSANELKTNISFITIVFFIHFFLLTLSQPTELKNVFFNNILVIYIFKMVKVFTFSVYIYALYELNLFLFDIREKLLDDEIK